MIVVGLARSTPRGRMSVMVGGAARLDDPKKKTKARELGKRRIRISPHKSFQLQGLGEGEQVQPTVQVSVNFEVASGRRIHLRQGSAILSLAKGTLVLHPTRPHSDNVPKRLRRDYLCRN